MSSVNNMVNYNLILKRAKALMWVYLLSVFALKLFGFEIIGNITTNNEFLIWLNDKKYLSMYVRIIVSVIGFNIIYASFISDRKIVLKLNAFVIIHFVVLNSLIVLDTDPHYALITSIGLYFAPVLFKIHPKVCLKIICIDFVFQFISVITRDLSLTFANQHIIVSLVYALDQQILWIIYFLNRKGNIECHSWELVDFCSTLKNQNLNTSLKCIKAWLKKQQVKLNWSTSTEKLQQLLLNWKLWLKFTLPIKCKGKLFPFSVFLLVYFGYAFIMSKHFESVFLLLAYGSFRFMYPKQFHADYIPNITKNIVKFACIALSCIVLCTALFNTLELEYSILSSIVVAFVVDWLLYIVTDWLDLSKRYDTDFTKYGLSHEKAKFAYDYKVNKMTIKQQMAITGLTEQVVRNYRSDVNRAMRNYELTKEDK